MKRVVISLVLLLLIAFGSWFSIYRVGAVKDEVLGHLEGISGLVGSGGQEELLRRIAELRDYWQESEQSLGHYVRHTQIDEISRSVAQLHALAEYGDASQLKAELDIIEMLIRHVWESELPLWRNIL